MSSSRQPRNRGAFALLVRVAIFLLVFGGIYGGFFSPTEGAAVGSAAAFVAALIKREYTFDELKELNARDFKALLSGPETGPGKNEMAELRKLWLLRAEYAAYIEAFTIDDKPKDGEKPAFGSIKATLDTMSGPQRERKIDPRKIKEAEKQA